jgi:hypothetical protein
MLAPVFASLLAALASARAIGPSAEPTTSRGFDRLPGFNAVVSANAEATLGKEAIPFATGVPLEPGLFVTIGPERVWVYDREIGRLHDGTVTEPTAAPECAGRCPATLFDAMRGVWLALAIESTQHDVEIPARLAIVADKRVRARTMLQIVYAAAASRPVRPPDLALVVGSPGRGLQAQPFHVLPPKGLQLDQGSAVLGLRVEFGRGRYHVDASDQRYVQNVRVTDLGKLTAILAGVKKRYPGKEAIILVPDDTVSIGDLVAVIAAVRADFPRIVLSLGQDVDLP